MPWTAPCPLIVQSAFIILVETNDPEFEAVRGTISRFADLIKSPEHLQLSDYAIIAMECVSRRDANRRNVGFFTAICEIWCPSRVLSSIRKYVKRYGILRMENVGNELDLVSDDTVVLKEISAYDSLKRYLEDTRGERAIAISPISRGVLKQELIKLGYPVEDLAAYRSGEFLPIQASK